MDVEALKLLAKQFRDKFKLVESGELELEEFQVFMDYYRHEVMTIMENS